MNADQMTASLRRWGLVVDEHPGWRTNNRNAAGPWGPVNGTMVHHTAGSDGQGIINLCYVGRSDLPGPLCHGVVHKDGSVTLVGNGRANHAGSGSSAVYTAIVNETALPKPGPDTVDGNTHFYGWECVNKGDGSDPWPEVQLDAIARVQAAVCEHHGWSAGSVIGHKEWTTRKIDPRGFSMDSMRGRVQEHMTRGDGMPTAEEIATAVVNRLLAGGGALENSDLDRIWSRDGVVPAARPPYQNADYDTNKSWTAGYALQVAVEAAREAAANTRGPVTLTDDQLRAAGEAGAEAALRLLAQRLLGE